MARAQQPGKVKRIGFLRIGPPPPMWIENFRQGLREHGLSEGQNITIDFGLAHSAPEVPAVAAELVRRNVDVLVASGVPSLQPAMDAAGTIPIVFVAAIDLVESGMVASLARPSGNITGMSAMQVDMYGKRLQLLKEVLPNLSRIALLVRAASPARPLYVRESERSAQILGVDLQILDLHNPSELETLFANAQGAGGLVVSEDAVFTAHREQIAELALKHRLPTIFGFSEMVEVGGLMSYGPHFGDLYRRAAGQVHKILNEGKPADIPIEQPTKFELVINLRTAKAIGHEVPAGLVQRADRLIE